MEGRWRALIVRPAAPVGSRCIPQLVPPQWASIVFSTGEWRRLGLYARAPGGQFVLHARTLPGNPYDGHTLGAVIEATERLTGREIERAYVDKGYRGHDTPNPRRVFISGQKRGVFGRIKRELTRRSAIEAVIGHMKAEGHLGRCYLKGRAGDAANVI